MLPVSALDVREGKLLLRSSDTDTSEAIVWIRARGARVHWFEADVMGANALAQQRAMDAAITAMQLTFSALLVLASLALYIQSRKKIFGGMALLGLLSALYHLQRSGAFISLLGQDLSAFIRLNTAMAVVLGCAGLYASAAVVASPRFKLLYQRSLSGLLAASVLLAAFGYYSSHGAFNMAAVALMTIALYGFCADCTRQWLQHRAWRQGLVNQVLIAVFLLMVLINLSILCHLFAPAVHVPWADELRALNLPVLSMALMLTLLWRQQRAQSVKERRRHVNLQKLQELISIRFLQQQFIAMLVHEIKTPLTVLQLGTNALVKDHIAPERKQAWNLRMLTGIKSIVHILDNCSQAERYEGGVMAVAPMDFLVAEVLDTVKLQALDQANDMPDRLQLRFESPMDGLQLHTDPSYFQIMLNNLVGNALKYSQADSAVVVQLSRLTDAQGAPRIQIAVRNTIGPWGSPDPEKVFSRYYRSDKASGVSGTGLGLWLSQKLAERLGTRIQLSLEAGQVVFWFTLPVLQDTENSSDTPFTIAVQTS
jgi:signal transduction histidine kinase